MTPKTFKGHNIVFGKDQPEYQPLPALRLHDGQVITCWELTDEELQDVIKNKCIYVQQMTFNHPLQPIYVSSDLDNIASI